MDDLFTSTTVFLAEKFVKSCSKETLQSKLSKLRLVTGVQFSKANKSYALTGKWEQVDSAFEILTHWHENPSHEPDFENAWEGKIAKLCECAFVNDFLLTFQHSDQSESESRTEISDEIEEAIVLLENEYSSLKENNISKTRPTVNSRKTEGVNVIDAKSVKSVILSRHRKDIENSSILSNKHKENSKFTSLNENIETNKALANDASVLDNVSSALDTTDYVSNVSPNVEICSSSRRNRKAKSNSENSSELKGSIKLEKEENESYCSEHKDTGRKSKKPGDIGYWSRVKRNDINEAHECEICNVTLKSRKRYLEHMRRIHIKEYHCTVCDKRFGYPTDLKRHRCPGAENFKTKEVIKKAVGKITKEKAVPESLEFKCNECDYATRFKKRLTSHVQRLHRKELGCDECDKTFGFQKDLDKHKENIHNENATLFFCDQCSKLYKNKQIFENHLKTHEIGYVKQYYTCEHCAKSFTTKYSLAGHLKTIHLGLKKEYLCQMCGKKFSQRSSYKQHCNAHNGVKPYKCNICGKAFVYHKSLKEHKFMHDNIRRFQCSLCEKAFRQRTTLHIHMKIHKTVKDHVCGVCGRGFSQKQAMERHERIHTGVRPYTCLICKKSFGDTSTIRRHMVSLHQKTETNWREDISSTVKKRSDYYVYGGTGQNRVYKSHQTEKSTSDSNINATLPAPPKPVQAEPSLLMTNSQPLPQESSFIVLNPVQNNILEPKYDFEVNGGTGSSLNNDGIGAFENIQPGTIYAIPSTQQQQQQNQIQSAPATPANNNFSQIIDFSTLTFVATKVQPETEKNECAQQIFQQPMQVLPQNTNILQNATVVPMPVVSDSIKVGQAGPSNQVSADSSLSQAFASIWGFVGYPSYQAQGNLPPYQNPPQNQPN